MTFVHDLNPVLFNLGFLEVRYYGLAYFIGFIFAYFFIKKYCKDFNLNLDPDDVSNLLIIVIISSITIARLFYAIVYNFNFFITNPWQIFMIWKGGLSIHGGIIGACIGMFIFSRWKKVHFLDLTDIGTIPITFGLILSRIANFINSELYGKITNLPWGVKFKDVEGFRHPSQLYESFKNAIILGILIFFKNKPFPRGFMTSIFLILYAVFRFVVEFFRAPDPQLGYIILGFSMGHILSIIMFFIGISLLYYIFRKR